MNSVLRLLSVESLKYQRTVVARLAFGIPLLYGCFVLMGAIFLGSGLTIVGETPWEAIARLFNTFWEVLIFPVGVIIISTQACQLVQVEGMWQRVATQPVSRLVIYIIHLIGVAGLVLCGVLIFSLTYLVIGMVLGARGAIPWSLLFGRPLLSWVAVLPMLLIQTWISMRFRTGSVPLSFGMAGFLGGLVINTTHIRVFVPWTYASAVHNLTQQSTVLLISAFLSFLLLITSTIDISRRDAV